MKPLWICLGLLAATAPATADVFRWLDPVTGKTVVSDQPPTGSYRQLVRIKRAESPEGPSSFAVRQAAEKYPVTLFTTPTCLAECRSARDLLNGRGVPFAEQLLQKQEQFDALQALSGNTIIPTVKIGSQVLQGLQAEAWNNILDLAGYPAVAPIGSKPVAGLPGSN